MHIRIRQNIFCLKGNVAENRGLMRRWGKRQVDQCLDINTKRTLLNRRIIFIPKKKRERFSVYFRAFYYLVKNWMNFIRGY